MGRRPFRPCRNTQAKPASAAERPGLRPRTGPLLNFRPYTAARPLVSQEAGLISKPLKIRYHSVV